MTEESLGIMIFIAYSQPDIAERFFAVAQNDRQADNIRPCLLNSFVLFARATISRPSDIQIHYFTILYMGLFSYHFQE